MPVNHEVKGNLAKLLATENLVIEHKKVSTASFDVINRVLVLPIWDRASSTVYDLLVGHEVGHALYTPADDWRECLTQPIPPDYVNVIEDARIEKLMKRKYPGLRKSFYNGYQELNDSDFFSIADEDVSKLSLIDRINLHFKVGNFALVPFGEDEKQFVEMTEEAETFADVLLICEQLVTFLKNTFREEEAIPANSPEQLSGSGSMTQQNSDSGDNSEGDNADENGDEENNTNESNSVGNLDNKSLDVGNKGGGPSDENVSKTQRSFDSGLESLTDKHAMETDYVELPDIYLDEIIVDNKILRDYMNKNFQDQYQSKIKYWGEIFQNVDTEYRQYKQVSNKEVNYLVKEFECKKSADAYARTSTARTGVLDTKILHSYKYNDDIFKKVSVVPDGKNHGLIFILDWSGSMGNYLLDTVKQLMNLVWFCRKVQIPFEVYAFTYEWNNAYVDPEADTYREVCVRKDRHIYIHNRFSLINFISSRTNTKDFENDCLNLWRLASAEDRQGGVSYNIPNGLGLSGTPLNESIIALHKIIPMFKNREKLQKVNVVILTDGEGNGLTYNVDLRRKYGSNCDRLGTNTIYTNQSLRDRNTGNVYRNFNLNYKDSLTTILLENLKDNFPYVNMIGFRIMTGGEFSCLYRNINNLIMRCGDYPELSIAMKKWRKDRSYEFDNAGYDALYGIASNKLNQDTSFEIAENATTAQIGKAFRDMMKTKRTSKKILSSFATMVS